jgi:hypothetical protein
VATDASDTALAEQAAAEAAMATARVKELEQMRTKLDRREVAAARLPTHRQRLLDKHREVWTALIQKHWAEYQSLVVKAGLSPNQTIRCTICIDSFLMFCLICDSHNNGKCGECHGSGHLTGDEICPSCSSTGVCFLCAGTGKMPCPFCDQRGFIHVGRPAPSWTPIPL